MKENKNYIKRIIDEEIAFRLRVKGAINILGPKYCGKTTTASMFANTIIKMKDPNLNEAYIETAKTTPSNLLKGEKPVLLDEWQVSTNLWDAVRTSCDDINKPGLYILTGSNNVTLGKNQHTGTGRISSLKMYPMSLYESNESTGEISLKDLFNGKFNEGVKGKLDINQLIFAACRGGWPTSLSLKGEKEQLFIAKDYFNSICKADISEVDERERDNEKTKAILRSYARNISTLAKDSTIYSDVIANYKMSDKTFDDYVKALKRLCIIENINAWCPAIRSKNMIRSTSKKELVDPSIAVAALNLSPEILEKDLKTFGFLFECLCIRDLKVYLSSNGNISYYHDNYGLEADAVIHLDNGKSALIEFKLGSSELDEAAKHLLKIRRLIKEHNQKEKQMKINEPDLMLIITGGPIAYTRSDGVKVIPISALKD